MHRYANAGPISHGLAAMSEPVTPKTAEPATLDDMRHGMALVTEAFRQIGDIADQVSEIAAQMVDIRKRLDALENMERGRLKCEAGVEPFSDKWHEQNLFALGFDLPAERRKQSEARDRAWQAQQQLMGLKTMPGYGLVNEDDITYRVTIR